MLSVSVIRTFVIQIMTVVSDVLNVTARVWKRWRLGRSWWGRLAGDVTAKEPGTNPRAKNVAEPGKQSNGKRLMFRFPQELRTAKLFGWPWARRRCLSPLKLKPPTTLNVKAQIFILMQKFLWPRFVKFVYSVRSELLNYQPLRLYYSEDPNTGYVRYSVVPTCLVD